MIRRICPKCGSTKIYMEQHFMDVMHYRNPQYVCEKCGLRGLFPVKDNKKK
ncbi:hypothetical protein ACFLQN_02820 [Candidatus Aenigmatarchaeota archaeon]